ncbi:MAG TPA: tetratricopeptide repeat protein [Rhodanobacter sp.]|nr:tetratricopeptide repeat protein [Rhodanobacter sp.]
MEGTSQDPQPASAPDGWRCGQFVLEPGARRLLRDDIEIKVEDRVFDLIMLLLHQRDRALDRREIIDTLWGTRPVSDATLRQLVHKARRALDDDGEHQNVIRTLYGRSLQWVAAIEPLQAAVHDDGDEAGQAEVAWPDVDRRATGNHMPMASPDTVEPAHVGISGTTTIRRSVWRGASNALLIVLLVSLGVLWWRQKGSPRIAANNIPPAAATDSQGAVTLAVLPFLDMDAAHTEPYLSDGLTEEMISQLGRFPQLRVVARTSTFAFRGKAVDVRVAARKLGVGHVLEGSVQHSGARIRVRVSLVSADTGYTVWSNEYDAASGDVLKVEAEIAHAVISELRPQLDPETLARLNVDATVDPAAHDFYLVGLEYLNRRTTADITQAIVYFQRAIQTDPGYAPAWSSVASAYALLRDYNSDAPPDTHYDDALVAANKAIALDPQLATAHAVLGQLYEEHWQWGPAAQEFHRALQLDPSNATSHQWYAMYLWFTGDMPGALAQMRTAHDLDPLSPIIDDGLGRALLYTGQPDAAIAQYREALALSPRFALTHVLLAEAYTAKTRYAEALQEARTAASLDGDPPGASYVAMLGVALDLVGDHAAARQQQAILESRSKHEYVSGVSMGWLDAQLGDNDKAFANLSRAIADHDHLMLPVVASHDDSWRTDPRFAALLLRMGLPAH